MTPKSTSTIGVITKKFNSSSINGSGGIGGANTRNGGVGTYIIVQGPMLTFNIVVKEFHNIVEMLTTLGKVVEFK